MTPPGRSLLTLRPTRPVALTIAQRCFRSSGPFSVGYANSANVRSKSGFFFANSRALISS